MPVPSEPQRFGKYQILERIAAGGMAEVFKARLEGIGGFHRTYAIKRILPHLTSNPEFVEMLVDEAKIAGLLSHANIVQILDLGAIDDQYFIAMEYVNGKDLGQVLERCAAKRVRMPPDHGVYILIEMLKGLEYAHNRTVVRNGQQVPLSIVHRDVSPGNVLLSLQGEVKLTDFGIAKATVKALQTQAGVIKGRFDYMSPEQASGQDVDQRADLFSAGVVFYELLTGRHPFRQAGDARTLDAVRRGDVVPPSTIHPDIPPALDRVIADALCVDRDRRHPSATVFKDALNQYFHDSERIFSAATLAEFLRKLWQEGERIPKPSEVDTGPMARKQALAAAAVAPAPYVDASGAAIGLALPALGEELTLIRNPTLDPDMLSGLAPPSQWSEMETVIRPDPFGPPPPTGAPRRAMPPPSIGRAAEPNDRGQVMQRPPLPPRPPRPVEPGPSPRRVDVPMPSPDTRPRVIFRTPNHVHLAYVIVCFCTLLVGLGFGFLLGRTATPRAEPGLLQVPPAVEIRAPAGFTATLDGKPLAGSPPWTASLVANAPTILRVEGPGAVPMEARLQLPPNQIRVIDFTPPAAGK